MVVTVEGKVFTKLIRDVVKTTGKTLINFSVDEAKSKIDIQVFDIYTTETSIACHIIERDEPVTDFSVSLSTVLVVVEEDSPVQLTFKDTALTIEQKSFEGMFLREYEARQQFPNKAELVFTEVNANRLKYLVSSSLAISPVLKELKITENDPMFSGGLYYTIYSSICFTDKFEFPETCLPFSSLKAVVYKLGESAEMCYIKERNIIVFVYGDYSYWINTTQYNMNAEDINAIQKKYSECKEITTVSLVKEVERLKAVSSAFPIQKAILSIYENSYSVSVNTGIMNISIGNGKGAALCSITTTTGTLATISKLFKDVEEITVKKGVNCLCLQQKNSAKSLMVFGMVW